jgi:ABC-type transporter Mla subunit MlaD
MAFTVHDFQDLLHLLNTHPEWQQALRRAILDDEFLQLPQIVRELAKAQQRTEQRVEELAEAQKRTDEQLRLLGQSVQALSEAQKRTDEQLRLLWQSVQELSEAQKRTEQKVDNLARELGGLKASIGASFEEEATSVTETVMRLKGFRLLEEAHSLRLNGEVDVILRVEDPQGRRLTVVAEAKTRLGRRNVFTWAQRMRSAGWQKKLRQAGYEGPYLAYVYGIRADLAVKEAVRETGLGLIKGEGEIIPPAGEIG